MCPPNLDSNNQDGKKDEMERLMGLGGSRNYLIKIRMGGKFFYVRSGIGTGGFLFKWEWDGKPKKIQLSFRTKYLKMCLLSTPA